MAVNVLRASERLGAPVFWAAALVVVFVGLGTPSLRGSEDRFAEIAREMTLHRDYFHPTLNGESHFHKPLLSYWSIVASRWLERGSSEMSARLPSAIAALIALAATVRLGTTVWSPAVGRLAGWVLLSSYGFLLWSRTAAADMENLAAVVLAVAWFRSREDRPGWLLYSVFALICAVGAQAKGLAPIAIPALVLVAHLWRYERWRDHLRGGPLVAAALLGLAAYLAPLVWAEASRGVDRSVIDSVFSGDPESGLYMVFQENLRRFYAPHDHRGPVYTYVLALPVLLLPWALVFVAALVDCVRDRVRLDPETRWLLWSIALIFAVFTVSGSRRSYYVLPILPFCALVVAVVMDGQTRRRFTGPALQWTRKALVLAATIEAVGALGLLIMSVGAWQPIPVRLAGATLLLAVLAFAIWKRGERFFGRFATRLELPAEVAVPLALAVVLFGGYFAVQYPLLDRFRTEKPFALELRVASYGLSPGRVAFVRHVPPLFPFYMDATEPLPVLRDAAAVRAFARGGRGVVVASPRSLRRLEGGPMELFERSPDLQEILHPWGQADERLGAWWIDGRGIGAPVLSRQAGG